LNEFRVSAHIVQAAPIRYTPAGIPALDLMLEHASTVLESGHPRQVKLSIRAVAFGTLAETLSKASFDDVHGFSGYLGLSRNGKGVVFHIQDIHRI